MYNFGERSKRALATCCEELNTIANEAIQIMDFAVLYGRRSKAEQNRLYDIGLTHLRWPEGRHNVLEEGELSDALDFIPWPKDWNDRERFTYYAGIFVGIGRAKGIRIRWGGDWNMDFQVKDNNFDDLGHIEIIR